MFEIADRLLAALGRGETIAVATAVAIDGSAPRTVGTSMAYDGTSVIGSIAGGCVEAAVVGVCDEVLADGASRTVEYGISDETAFDVGLTCGGQLRIHVQLVSPQSAIADALRRAGDGESTGVASVIGGGSGAIFERRIQAELESRIALGDTALGAIDCDGEAVEVFFEVATAPARMIIFGAMEFSAALGRASAAMGYRVTVCDPRPLFATAERFPGMELVVEWPTHYLERTMVDARTAICILSHDDRYDTDLVELALSLPAAYVGAMGSRRTSDRRFEALRGRGVPDASLARLHSPIGLDIGASTPEETAVSILGEILTVRTGRGTEPLSTTSGSIHRSSVRA
jgi:xanthine dehydrogenase accessory factor